MRCRLRAGVALVVLGLMWGVLFLVPFAAPWIGFGVLGLPCGSIWFQIGSYLVPIGSYGFYSSQIGSYKLKMVT